MTASTPFPVLRIERIQSGFYNWNIALAGHVLEHEEGAPSIEECLTQAFQNLPEENSPVEIRYRGVGLGTFSAKLLHEGPDMLADSLVEKYSAVIGTVT